MRSKIRRRRQAMLRNGLTARKQEEPARTAARAATLEGESSSLCRSRSRKGKRARKRVVYLQHSGGECHSTAGGARQPGGSSGFAPPRAIEVWRVLRVPLCLYKRRMRRLARERERLEERKSDNGDGGSLLCVITTRATSANQRGQFQRGSTRR